MSRERGHFTDVPSVRVGLGVWWLKSTMRISTVNPQSRPPCLILEVEHNRMPYMSARVGVHWGSAQAHSPE